MAKLTLINGKLRVVWGSSESGSIVEGDWLSPSNEYKGCCCNDCTVLKITYDWSESSSRDLDTGTTFLGTKVGWSCGDGSTVAYILWSGDNTSASASEYVLIYFKAALDAERWSGSVEIDLAAGWYIPAGGSGPAKVIVECYDVPNEDTKKTKTINPGAQSNCASTNVGKVTINEDGTFELE
jgi:hypothetical protein